MTLWRPGDGPRYGDAHFNTRLSDEDALHLRELHQGGIALRVLAARFHISLAQAGRITRGEQRRHLVELQDPLPVRRNCADGLPALPFRRLRDGPGYRAFQLMALNLEAISALGRNGDSR